LAYQLQVNNGVSQQYTYTAQNQIATITDMTGTTKDAAFAYTYDADGDETQEVEKLGNAGTPPTQTINYTYNADGMLYSETATNSGSFNASVQSWAIYYGYDADGNRLETNSSDFLNNQGDIDFDANFWTYNANGELTEYQQFNPDQDNPSYTTTYYTYDSNGNEVEADFSTEHQMQEDGDGNVSSLFYTYDVRGELVKYVDPNGTTTTYTYDDSGNRVKEVTPVSGHNTTTTYLIDGNNPTGEAQAIEEHVNGAAVPSITYFGGLDGTQGQTSGSTVIYMLRDNRGYARVFTNAAGTATQYDQYDAFGNQTTGNNIPTTHYLPDGVFDAPSGLVFHVARQESTFNGNFIERDFGAQGLGNNDQPISLNVYSYADADPINFFDPSGHYAEDLSVTLSLATIIPAFAPLVTSNSDPRPELDAKIQHDRSFAQRMAQDSIDILNRWNTDDQKLFDSWFGPANVSRRKLVIQNFQKIMAELTGPFDWDFGKNAPPPDNVAMQNHPAFTYPPGSPNYNKSELFVYINDGFWLEPINVLQANGVQNSSTQAGTILHEASHAALGTKDYAYDYNDCYSLAHGTFIPKGFKSPASPLLALANADNYRLFSEYATCVLK
jgi:RHS repeat-associated protein